MNFDYQFLKSIILVLIPTGIGAYVTTVLTNSWQSKKEKNEIKRKILSDYDNHAPKTYSLIGTFHDKIFREYVDHGESNFVKEEGRTHYKVINISETNPPIQKFPTICHKFIDEYWEASYAANQFLRSLRLYYHDEELEKEHEKLVERLGITYLMTEKLIYATNTPDFLHHLKEIDEELPIIRNAMKDFETKLINKKLIIK